MEKETKESDQIANLELVALKADKSAILALTGAKSSPEALGILMAWKKGYEDSGNLARQIEMLKGDMEARERQLLIERALSENKLTKEQVALAAKTDLATLKSYVDTASPVLKTAGALPKEVQAVEAQKALAAAIAAQDYKQIARLMKEMQ